MAPITRLSLACWPVAAIGHAPGHLPARGGARGQWRASGEAGFSRPDVGCCVGCALLPAC